MSGIAARERALNKSTHDFVAFLGEEGEPGLLPEAERLRQIRSEPRRNPYL